MKTKWLLLLFFTISSVRLYAQPAKSISHWKQVWLRNFNQIGINNKWSFLVNFHFKTQDDFVKGLSQYIIEGGLNYHISNKGRISVVHTYAANYPDNRKAIPLPEYRPWQQYQLNVRHGKNSMVQAFRLEERFRRRGLK